MRKFLWLLAAFGAFAGAFFLAVGVIFSNGAPQQAAAGAIAAACAVVPYVLARSNDEFSKAGPGPIK